VSEVGESDQFIGCNRCDNLALVREGAINRLSAGNNYLAVVLMCLNGIKVRIMLTNGNSCPCLMG